MSYDFLTIIGWYFLPNLVTGWVQSAYYAVWIRAGDPKPQRGTRQFVSDFKRIYVTVILAYLSYTIYNADYTLQQQPNFYSSLGVPLDVDDRGLNSRFRRLTVLFHPDKISSDIDPERAEAYYVHLKQCRDVLMDPVRRFAYDRFGPDIVELREAKTLYDFVYTGSWTALTYYIGSVGGLFLLSLLGYLKHGSFWRYLTATIFFAFELYTVSRPDTPLLLARVVNPIVTTFSNHPPYLQYQMLALMRQVLISFFIALSQLGPVFFPPQPAGDHEPTQQQLDRLDAVMKASAQETQRLTALELTPFLADPANMRELKVSTRQWLMDNTVRQHPQVRDAMGRVLQPRSGGQANGRTVS